MKDTGAQNCGTAIAFTAMQALEHYEQCHIVSLDIRGAFNSVWWAGLLKHFWSVGLRSKAYGFLCAICVIGVYLWWLMVILLLSGTLQLVFLVPRGGVWSSILFNLYIQHLTKQVLHCDLFEYADDSSLVKVIKSKEDQIAVTEEIIADLNHVFFLG